MDFEINAFPASDSNEGIRSKEKIKILICYIFETVGQPLTKDIVLTSLYSDGIANYFEISQALYELETVEALEMIEENGLALYRLTPKGKQIASDLADELSLYIKHKATSAALKTILYEKRQRENKVEIKQIDDDKYRVDIALYSTEKGASADDKMLEVSVYVTDAIQANVIKRSFMNNPAKLYENVINALTEDVEFVE